jgi:riboflavin biosynthesis pyrimidine reductase
MPASEPAPAATPDTRIRWHLQRETRFPFGRRLPGPEGIEAIGFPPPWIDRPWIYATMVCSANGVVAWRRAGPGDDPVLAILGGDEARPEREADRRHVRHLRCYGDVAIGAQTLREQPGLVQTPQEPGDPPAPALYGFRLAHGLPLHPRHVIYSRSGAMDLTLPVFNTPGIEVIVVTTRAGADRLRASGAASQGIDLVADALDTPEGLRRAHERLFADRGVRYLDCEGGETVLDTLRAAGLLDEIFLTVTDVVVDGGRHAGVKTIPGATLAGADLIAEGSAGAASPWRFQRWRLNPR